jgi:SAM-dependent methyltransferase
MINAACGMRSSNPLRSRVCAGLHGQVVEIGFGSGHNVPFYPASVTGVSAIEPADLGWKLAGKRLAASAVAVERSGLDGQALPLPDDSFDTALSTWTLCTIPDAAVALGEVRRVLKPGGTLHFVEHGLAPDENVERWQHRWNRCRNASSVAATSPGRSLTCCRMRASKSPRSTCSTRRVRRSSWPLIPSVSPLHRKQGTLN